MATSRRSVEVDTDDVFRIIETLAAALIALTAVEAIMLLVNRSAFGPSIRLSFVKFGEVLFAPACIWVGWTARGIRVRRPLVLCAAFATAYLFLTQFRGSWIWAGTFDHYDLSPSGWMTWGVVGMIGALAASFVPATPRAEDRDRSGWYMLTLGACVLASALLPLLWPNDSEFAPTRSIGMLVALIVLTVLWLIAKVNQ